MPGMGEEPSGQRAGPGRRRGASGGGAGRGEAAAAQS